MCTNPKIYHRNIRKAFAFCGQRLSLAQILPSTLFHSLPLPYILLTQQIDWNLFFSGVWRFISFWCPPFLPLVSSAPHWKSISLRNYGFFHCSPFWSHTPPPHSTQYTSTTSHDHRIEISDVIFKHAFYDRLFTITEEALTDVVSNSVDIEIMCSFFMYAYRTINGNISWLRTE